MKLRKLYTNKTKVRPPIIFHDGLNVVFGEIRHPGDHKKDTHNLGKSLLAQLIDFSLLRTKKKDFFLFRHYQQFKDFVFFLELETHDGSFVTIRRTVEMGSTASFMRHQEGGQDFTFSDESDWDHWNLPYRRAVQVLDGLLDLSAISPWNFRRTVGYSLRSQQDFDEPFKLAKFAGKHAAWKPFLAHILGLNASLVEKNYALAEQVEVDGLEERRLAADLSGVAESADQLRGLVQIREGKVSELEHSVSAYDFEIADAEINRELVDRIDIEIAELNERRYYLSSNLERIAHAQETKAVVDLRKVQKIFEQAQIYFKDQLIKEYKDLERFNREISVERDRYLNEERREIELELSHIQDRLELLNRQRSTALSTLANKETFSKFKQLSHRLIEKKTDLEILRQRATSVARLAEVRKQIRDRQKERDEVQEEIERDVAGADGIYQTIRDYFNEIVESVIDRQANLYTKLNLEGNLEFHIQILDASGGETSAGEGFTYRRLLCIAFDMAVIRAYADLSYPHFVFHDGALETLDDRKKLNLLKIMRNYLEAGTQHIITLIDSELPRDENGNVFSFDDDEIILHLHDDGPDGLLFRMPAW